MANSFLAPDAPLPRHLLDTYAEAISARRRRTLVSVTLLVLAVLTAGWMADLKPLYFIDNIGKFTSYIGRIFVLESRHLVFTDPLEWFWGLKKWLLLVLETVLIAYAGTMIGFLGAASLAFLAARNLTPNGATFFIIRRILEFTRTVPEIVFAMIFVVAFGLGPLPGVLALAIHTTGALGKLFFEVAENIDMKPVEGIRATGGNWFAMVRFGVLPQILSNMLGYTLLRFEINVREGAVMGLVGAGGIGQDLIEAIRKFYYSDISAILLLIIVTVGLIDYLTEHLRHRLIGLGERQ